MFLVLLQQPWQVEAMRFPMESDETPEPRAEGLSLAVIIFWFSIGEPVFYFL